MLGDDVPAVNTDRELWREPDPPEGLFPARLFVTVGGGIGMDVGGHCVVQPIRQWHQLTHPSGTVAYDRVLAWLKDELRLDNGVTEHMHCWRLAISAVEAMRDGKVVP
jgi:hypothetical protein